VRGECGKPGFLLTSLVMVIHDRRLARRLGRVLELHGGVLRELALSEV